MVFLTVSSWIRNRGPDRYWKVQELLKHARVRTWLCSGGNEAWFHLYIVFCGVTTFKITFPPPHNQQVVCSPPVVSYNSISEAERTGATVWLSGRSDELSCTPPNLGRLKSATWERWEENIVKGVLGNCRDVFNAPKPPNFCAAHSLIQPQTLTLCYSV